MEAPFTHNAADDVPSSALPDRRRCFGVLEAPVVATHAYRLRPQDDSCRRFEKWALVNERAGTVTFVATIDGRAGRDYDAVRNTFSHGLYSACAALDEFEPVPVERCPVAVRDPLAGVPEDWQRLAA